MYTLEKLVSIVNEKLEDAGIPNTVNERLVRHYTSSRVVPPAYKDGKEARYDDTHIAALLSLRSSQSAGISSKALKNLSTSVSSELETKSYSMASNAALSFLSSLPTENRACASFNALSVQSPVVGGLYGVMDQVPPVVKSETWDRLLIADGIEINLRKDKSLTPVQIKNITSIIKGDSK